MEIEIKAIITEGEFKKALQIANKISPSRKFTKIDRYFSKYETIEESVKNKENTIRIRTESDKSYFTVKYKNLTDTGEINSEEETEIGNAEVIESFLLSTGYNEVFSKVKDSHSFYKTVKLTGNGKNTVVLHSEIEIINYNIYAIEIECIRNSSEDFEKIHETEIEFLETLGISREKIDNRPWMQIIREKKEF